MTSFFHLSSILYRNVFKGHPPVGFSSKWSCDIFFTMAFLQHGKLHYADEDMSIYRQHKAGTFSGLPEVAGRIYNIEASRVISDGKRPVGAHSDIAKAEVAHIFWEAVLSGV